MHVSRQLSPRNKNICLGFALLRSAGGAGGCSGDEGRSSHGDQGKH